MCFLITKWEILNMKAEFRSKVTKYNIGRYHIEIPSYVREDIEDFTGECIKVSIKKKSPKTNNQIKFESKVSTYGPERIHIEIPASFKEESKKLLGEKIIVLIEIK